MKRVMIMRGLPGSGKSTIAEKEQKSALEQGKSTAYCSADQYFIDHNGNYNFDPKLTGNAHIYCMRRFLEAIHSDKDLIIVDNTNTQVWEYTPYMQVALAEGYDVRLLEVVCDKSTAFARNIHDVPAAQHTRMADRYQKALPHHKRYVMKVDNNESVSS